MLSTTYTSKFLPSSTVISAEFEGVKKRQHIVENVAKGISFTFPYFKNVSEMEKIRFWAATYLFWPQRESKLKEPLNIVHFFQFQHNYSIGPPEHL